MKAIDRQFTQIINGTTQFIIPVFQRDYSWTETQCEELWKDVVRVANGDSDATHFLGSLVYAPTGDSSPGFTRWLLIDGQQRVTTLVLLLTALRDHISDSGWMGGEDDPTARRVEAYFLRNLQEDGSRRQKLVLRRHDQETLAAVIDRQPYPAGVSERIRDNFEFFRECVAKSDPAEVYRGVGRIVVVDVTLNGPSDNPQLVFESLNSTGIDLSQSDLIRNYILMRHKERDQTRLYELYWSRIEVLFRGSERTFDAFIRDFVALQTRQSKQEKSTDIYRAFREFYTSWRSEVGGDEAALSELLRFARYYAAFSTGVGAPAELIGRLTRLRQLVDVPAMLVMKLFDCFDRLKTLSLDQFQLSLSLLESYVFRRAIGSLQTRAYWQVFANIAYRVSDQHPLKDLKVALARQHENYRFPTDDEFRRDLFQRDLYALRVCRFLLETLENAGMRELSDTSSYSIEHIMPQNPSVGAEWRQMLGDDWQRVHQTWIHRIGNLTLTGYNSSYSDRPFQEKKSIPGGFSDSAVRLNRFVRDQQTWNEECMMTRSNELADRALTVWPSLQVDESLIVAARERELRELASRRNVHSVKMSPVARDLFEILSSSVRALDAEIIEIAETNSVSYYDGTQFFLEVLPRKNRLSLLLPIEFHEVLDPHGVAQDASQWKFFFHAQHGGGVFAAVEKREDIEEVLPLIKQARSLVLT